MRQCSPLLRDYITFQCHPEYPIIVKKFSARKPFHILTEFLNVKKKTDVHRLSADILKRKTIRVGIMLWSSIPKRKGHKKMNKLRNLFIFGFQNNLRMYSLQLKMIALQCILMVTLNHICLQNCSCKCLSGKLIISWWFPQKRVYLSRQEMLTIISSLVILHYNQFFRPNLRRFLHSTKSCAVVSAAYLPKVCIHIYYHAVIVL